MYPRFAFSGLCLLLALLFGAATAPAHAANPAEAAKAAYAGRYAQAQSLAQGDPAAEKLVEWVYLRNEWNAAGYDRITSFLNANPHWPLQETLGRRAEQSLLLSNESPAQIEAHFRNGAKPKTADGMLALARAAAARGEKTEARRWASRAWRIADASAETRILNEFSDYLSADDHKARLWRLIYEQEADAAIRTARRLPAAYQRAATAAKALFNEKPGAVQSYRGLPLEIRRELAMRYALARYYRTQDKNVEAAEVLMALPTSHEKLIDPEQIWIERRLVARDLLAPANRAHWPTAYKLAAAHGYTQGQLAAEGEFLSGWIALRFIKKPSLAMPHFQRLERVAMNRTEKARAMYWIGRTHEATGEGGKAEAAYQAAARYATVYYGQLALEKLGKSKRPIPFEDVRPSATTKAKVENDELIRAFRIVGRIGKDADLGLFLNAFSLRFDTPEEAAAAASVAWDVGGPHLAVKLAKLTATRGNDIDNWGYPTKAMPEWRHRGPPVEKALVYGLARQESEFNATAGSGAGARGLMQLMPGTAKIVARQYGMPYAVNRLTSDPAYNVTLGAAHLGDLIEEFEGSYILTLAAYNAGPRRAAAWVEQFGDPRSGEVDPVDWVEQVPYTETRGYIQKVLQNVHVYRSRIDPANMRGMSADLSRGSPGAVTVANKNDPGTAKCGEDAGDLAELIKDCQ